MNEQQKRIIERAVPWNWPVVPEMERLIREADIVYGFDFFANSLDLFYGVKFLGEVLRKEQKRSGRLIAFIIDSRARQSEQLASACRSLKGSCDFRGDPYAPSAN